MTINPSGQHGSSQLRKYLGDAPEEVIRSTASLSQLPSSVRESFQLLNEVLRDAQDGLREEVIEALRRKLLPWLDKNAATLSDLPCLEQISPIPNEIIEEHEIEWLKLEDRCFDPRLPQSVRAATLKILDICDGGRRVELEQLRIEEDQKRAKALYLQRNPPRPPVPKIRFAGYEIRQDLLFFKRHRIETIGREANLIITSGKTEAIIGPFCSVEDVQKWLEHYNLFKDYAGSRFSETETDRLQSDINSFEAMLRKPRAHYEGASSDSNEQSEEPSSPAPQKFIDPLMPLSEKFDMPEIDYQ